MRHSLTRREFAAGLVLVPFAACRSAQKLAGIEWEVVRNGDSPRRFLVIHGNERTAVEAVHAFMKAGHEGTAYVVTGETRNVRIEGVEVDPNRIFSREGAERSILRLNPEAGEAQMIQALNRLDALRAELLEAILPPPGGLLIAAHNNSQGYSIQDEIPISDKVSLKAPGEPHDFYLFTAALDFEVAERSPYNAVLQKSAPEEDDGSLSRLAANRGIRYVNNEVALGRYERQMEMLSWLYENLPERRVIVDR
jgi:hypothetical protein